MLIYEGFNAQNVNSNVNDFSLSVKKLSVHASQYSYY